MKNYNKADLIAVLTKAYVKVEAEAVYTEIDAYSKLSGEDYEPSLFSRVKVRMLIRVASILEKVLLGIGTTKECLRWEVCNELIS